MMRSLAERAIRKAGDDAEVYTIESTINAIYIDGSKISNIETKNDIGMSVRIAGNGKVGTASVTLDSDDSADRCVAMASRLSSLSPVSEGFKGFAQPFQKKIDVNGLIDKKIVNIGPEDLMDIAKTIIDSCDTDIPRGLLRTSSIRSAVMNTNGVDVEHESTMMYGHFTSMARLEHPGEGVESLFGTHLDIDPVMIGESLASKARSAASAIPFKGRKELTMILPPSELGDMIMSSAGSALNGENVMYGRSQWKDRTGEDVASPSLTLTDDPTMPAPLCAQFDDEGVPSARKTLVEDGVLKGFLRDTFAGESTGNGMRRSSVESQGIYENPISIKPMNLVISRGNRSVEEIISNTQNGILVEKFAWPEADSLTGRFGLEVRAGHLVENGMITKTVNNALLMGNMIDCLRRVEMIGNDPRNMGCVTVPTMSFSGVELIGN